MTALLILPGEWLFMRVGAACGSLSPKRSSNAKLMHKELADEVVVVMKRIADEGMVTCVTFRII
jgi:hypothetical protein